jgi:hypothetical protein
LNWVIGLVKPSHGAGAVRKPEASAEHPQQAAQAAAQSDGLWLIPRLEAARLDADFVRYAHPAVMRVLELECARCEKCGRCERDPVLPVANERLAAYCPNTDTIDAVVVADR